MYPIQMCINTIIRHNQIKRLTSRQAYKLRQSSQSSLLLSIAARKILSHFFVSHLYGDCEWSVFFSCVSKPWSTDSCACWSTGIEHMQICNSSCLGVQIFDLFVLFELTCIEGPCRRCGWKQRVWWKGTTTKESGKPWVMAFVVDWNLLLRIQRK